MLWTMETFRVMSFPTYQLPRLSCCPNKNVGVFDVFFYVCPLHCFGLSTSVDQKTFPAWPRKFASLKPELLTHLPNQWQRKSNGRS